MEYLKMALDCFFAVWFVVGNVWIFGGHSSSTEAPNMYRQILNGRVMVNVVLVSADESDPASGEGCTQVFDRVREKKQSGTGKVPIMPTESSYSNGQKQYGNDSPKGYLCFPWGKK